MKVGEKIIDGRTETYDFQSHQNYGEQQKPE